MRCRTEPGAPRARNTGTTRPEDGRSTRNPDAPRARRIGRTRPGRATFRRGPDAPRAPHTGTRPGAGRARKKPGAPRARDTGSRPEGGMFRKNPGAPEAETIRGKAGRPHRGADTTLPHRPLHHLLLLPPPKAERSSGKRTGRGRRERRDKTRLLRGLLLLHRGTAGGKTGAATASPGRSGIPRGTGPLEGPEGGRGTPLLGDRGATEGGPRPPHPLPTASRRAERARLKPGGRGTAVRRRGA